MELLKLIGVVIVIVGFLLKKDTLAVVVLAGFVTGLVARMTPLEILDVLGSSFVSQRVATVFVLTLPAIGILERYGLKDKAVDLIRGIKNATTGRLLIVYQGIRTLAAAFSVRLGGHPQFIRPLINPMAQAAAVARYGQIDEKTEENIKGTSAASENFANFFAQNCFMGASGTLLIVSTLSQQGYEVSALQIATMSIPIAVISFVVSAVYYLILDRKMNKKYGYKAK